MTSNETSEPSVPKATDSLTHVDETGAARMVDIGHKISTSRTAIACAVVRMAPETLTLLENNALKKGDALSIARIAGIMAAKDTARLIPLCHPLPLTSVAVKIGIDRINNATRVEATVQCIGPTGVEMEALTAATVAALTLYDMAKGVDRTMVIDAARVVFKDGGLSGLSYHDPRPTEPRIMTERSDSSANSVGG